MPPRSLAGRIALQFLIGHRPMHRPNDRTGELSTACAVCSCRVVSHSIGGPLRPDAFASCTTRRPRKGGRAIGIKGMDGTLPAKGSHLDAEYPTYRRRQCEVPRTRWIFLCDGVFSWATSLAMGPSGIKPTWWQIVKILRATDPRQGWLSVKQWMFVGNITTME